MPLDRSKFKNIVGGITTPATPDAPPVAPSIEPAMPPAEQPTEEAAGQGGAIPEPAIKSEKPHAAPAKRFAKTGRPKGRTTGTSTREKVSLFIDKTLIDELYEWAHQDRVNPGEFIERALRSFRDRETKRRNAGTE